MLATSPAVARPPARPTARPPAGPPARLWLVGRPPIICYLDIHVHVIVFVGVLFMFGVSSYGRCVYCWFNICVHAFVLFYDVVGLMVCYSIRLYPCAAISCFPLKFNLEINIPRRGEHEEARGPD